MEDYVKDASLASNDEGLLRSYDKEQAYKDECYKEGRESGLKDGFEKGIEKGTNQRNIEIAKEMIKDKVAIDTIAKYTGLTIEELSKIKN